MDSKFLLPDPEDDDSAPFWQGTGRGELLVQVCDSCAMRRMPPRPMCPHCGSIKSRWDKLSGLGSIWSFVVAHPPLLPAYQEYAPYNVITVATKDDPALRFVGNLVATPQGRINEIDPASIRIGEPVQVVFQQIDDVYLPRWMRV